MTGREDERAVKVEQCRLALAALDLHDGALFERAWPEWLDADPAGPVDAELLAFQSLDSFGEFDDPLVERGDERRRLLPELGLGHVFDVAHVVLLSVVVWKLHRKGGGRS